MKKPKFEKTEDSKANKLYILVEFEGGDTDTKQPELIEVKGVDYINYLDNLDKIEEEVDKYKLLEKILDINSSKFLEDYDSVKEEYGEELANLFDATPNDPQNDYQNKCYIGSITLIAYDKDCNQFRAYLN